MRKQYLRVAIALIGFAGMSLAAKAQSPDRVEFKVSRDFVVAGKTLPAGTYRVARASANNIQMLSISNFDRNVTVYVVATEIEDNRTNKTEVTFQRLGGDYLLSKIGTAAHLFAFENSHREILTAAAGSNGAVSASASLDGSK